ncbi:hypothetical protein DFH06DRAFT_1382624 [Mycena polygramma]|nr:hypothetical protein DFH06DRAFT_1382624 [Mycena polygramma]
MPTLAQALIVVTNFLSTPEGAEILGLILGGALSPTDTQGGLYLYEGNGDIKAGFANSPPRRRREWERQCAPEVQIWWPFYWEVPHRKLFERIVHKYFKAKGAWRGPILCPYCGRRHIEKFDLALCGGRQVVYFIINAAPKALYIKSLHPDVFPPFGLRRIACPRCFHLPSRAPLLYTSTVNRDAATPQSTTGGGKLDPLFGCRTLQLPMMTRAATKTSLGTRCDRAQDPPDPLRSRPPQPPGARLPRGVSYMLELAIVPSRLALSAAPARRTHRSLEPERTKSRTHNPRASLRRIRTLRRLNVAAVAERVSEQDSADVTAETSSRKGKVLYEVRQAAGTVVHPSGFNPSTPADEFEHSGNCTTDSHIGQQPLVLGKRGFHTTAVSRAQEVQLDFNPVLAKQQLSETFVPRDVYTPTLATTPFWRPLITLTTSTCPIAMTLVPLAKGLPTGRPFHDTDNHDKKCRIPYVNRMRSMRMTRIQNLAVEMAQTPPSPSLPRA